MKIIFVCTGNTCRSPMAEVIAKDLIKKYNIQAEISSAGISVFCESGASENAMSAIGEYKLDLTNHISKQISVEDLEESSLILTMTAKHKEYLLSILKCKETEKKIHTLCEYAGCDKKDITDPFGQGLNEYKMCANELYTLIERIFENYDRNSK